MGFFAVLAASLFAVFLFTVFGGYSLLLWCQQSLWMIVPPAVVLAVLVWAFLKMDDKITALQKRVDELEAAGIRTFGPKKNAAILEGSKAFSKDLMKKYNIPTAAYENFTDPDKAVEYLKTEARFPIVLKADGLALGKGVLICNTLEEAKDGVKTIMEDKKFGDAGNRMVIEEFMTGREVSVLAFCDGKTIKCMTSAQDHKRAKDGDQGLNTGGMGTFSPSPFYTKEVEEFLQTIDSNITVAVMGCAVNGPGEAKNADIGIAGGIKEGLLFKKGKIIRKIPQDKIVEELKKEILEMVK